MAIVALRTTPTAEIEFHTADALYAVKKGGYQWDDTQPTRDVLSITTNKQMGSPVGTFQITLTGARGADGMDWYDRLDQNNLVVIKMGRPPEILATVMVGLIDEVRRTKIMGANGQPERGVLVRGSDFAKPLTKAMLVFYPSLALDPTISQDSFFPTSGGFVPMLDFFTGADLIQGRPEEMIQQAIVRILYRIMNMNFSYWESAKGMKTIHLSNVLRYLLTSTPDVVPFMMTMLDYEGAFWNFVERVNIAPFNEMFVDTRGFLPDGTKEYMQMVPNLAKSSYYPAGDPLAQYMADKGIDTNPNWSASFGDDESKVIFFLRRTPFDFKDWNNLYTHTVEYDALISEDLGFSDQENYNSFIAYNSLSVPNAVNLKLLVPPVMDIDNVKSFGMSPMEVQIEGISVDESGDLTDSISACQTLSQTLYDWYSKNRLYKAGTVQVKGNGYYKIGQRLLIKNCEYNKYTKQWDDLVFYIEGVMQSFNVMDSWTTTLTLTRGQRVNNAVSTTVTPKGTITTQTIDVTDVTLPSSVTSTATSQDANVQFYTVQAGDTLYSIAGKNYIYGDGSQWSRIWNENQLTLQAQGLSADPNSKPNEGTTLVIPMD